MVRTQGPPTDDSFHRRGPADRKSFVDDALPLDAGLTEADGEEDSQQFRRANRRVPVKRGPMGRKAALRVRWAVLLALVVGGLGAGIYAIHDYAVHSWRFRLRSAGDIDVAGEAPNSRVAVIEKMRESVGRNLFQISLAERKQELEKIPWVESATVIRLWPNHLRVMVKERTPVAFVAIGGRVELIDAQGVVMEMSPGVPADYAFPVILGMAEIDPLSTRAARMKTFARLMRELDGDEAATQSGNQAKMQYSRNLEEVDLSDPGDVKVTVKGPSGRILLHLGDQSFLSRFMVYLSNVQKWEQERGKLESVDLRYGREVILNPDMSAAPPAPAVPKDAPKATPKPVPQPAPRAIHKPAPHVAPHVAPNMAPRQRPHPNAVLAHARWSKHRKGKKRT
jgi:cell division protein FtsQ